GGVVPGQGFARGAAGVREGDDEVGGPGHRDDVHGPTLGPTTVTARRVTTGLRTGVDVVNKVRQHWHGAEPHRDPTSRGPRPLRPGRGEGPARARAEAARRARAPAA